MKFAGGLDKFKSIGDLFNSLSRTDAPENAIKYFANIGRSAKEAASKVDASASVIQKGIAGIGGGLKGAWNSLGLFGQIGIVITALGTLYGIYQKIQNAGAEANQKMDESVSKYEQTVSELESVNNELSDTQRQVDILQAKGSLNLVEQSELERLQTQTRELERQKDILEKMAAAEARQAAIDARKAVRANYTNLPTSDAAVQEQFDYFSQEGWYTDPGDKNISGLLANIQRYKNKQANLSPDDSAWTAYQQIIDSTSDKVWEAVSNWQDYKDTLESIPESARSAADNQLIQGLENSIDTVYRLLDNNTWKQMKLDDIYSSTSAKATKNTLIQMASGMQDVGITVDDVKEKFPELAAAAEQAGLEVQDVVDDINAAAGVVPGGKKKAVKDLFGKSEYVKGLGSNDDAMSKIMAFNEWINGLSDDELSVAYTLSLDASSATWSLDEWKAHLESATTDTENELSKLKESSENTLNTISGIQNAQKVLNSQEAGKSVSLSDFTSDDMKDYASALEYVNGTYQLNIDKVNELVKAKAQEQIETNKTNKAQEQSKYLENARQIEKYRQQLEAAKSSGEKSNKEIENSIEALLEENASIKANCASYDLMIASLEEATGAYQRWIDAQSAGESGDMFDSSLKALQQIDDTLNNSDSDLFGRVGREDYKAAVDFVVPNSIDKEDSNAVNSYIQSISDMFTYDKSGNKTGLNIQNFISKSVQEGLLVNDGDTYRIAGEKTMQDFADGLGLAMPLVRAMFGELEEFGAKFDWSDEASKTFGDLSVAAYEAVESLRDVDSFKDLKIVLDVSEFDDAEKACKTLDSSIKQMQDFKIDLNPEVDQDKINQVDDIIRYCVAQKQSLTSPAIMSVDVSKVTSEIAPALDLLQQFQNAQNNLEMDAAVGADTSKAETEIHGLVTQIQGLEPEILAKIGLNPEDADSIQTYINGLDAEAIVSFGIDSSLVDAFEKRSHTASGTVTWYNDESHLKKSFTRIGYVYWQNGNSPSGSGSGASRVNGSANVSGSAKLSGDWRAKGGRSLVGEAGTEIIVDPSTGRWYTVGDNGAEFVNVPNGAIIFNHKQTDALLNNGRVAGRGTSYASGSAFVTGYIPGNIGNSGSSSGGVSGRGNSSSSSGSTSSSSTTDKTDWPAIALSRIEALITKLTNIVSSSFKNIQTKLGASNDAIRETLRQIDAEQNAYNTYMREANSVGLAESLAVQVREGNVYHIGSYDEDDQKKIQEYQEWYEKALACKTAVDNLHESLAQLYQDRFDAVQEDYNNQLSMMEKQSDALSKKIDMLEEQGYMQNANYYAQMQDIERQKIQTMTKELDDLNKSFNEAMASGEIEEGSDAWYQMKLNIEDTKAAIDDAELSIVKYGNSIRQIGWDYFDYAQERVSQITSEAKFLQDLMDGEDMYDKNGNLSSAGTATMGLHAESYGVYMAQADKYAAEIKELNKQIASDPNNKILIKRRDELLASQRDSILAAKDEKEAMIDLAKGGIEVELNALKELIDAYTDSLDSAKNLYDYQKKIAEKTSNISSLEKQLAAYQNDMSEETRAKIQKIQLELKDARDDLKDTEYDRFVSDAKDALNSMYDEYENLLNSRFDDTDALFKELIGLVNDNFVGIHEYLSKEASSVGYSITEATNSLWANGGGANGLVFAYGADISTKLTSVGQTVESIFSILAEIARENGVPFSGAKSYKSGGLIDYTGIANVHGSASDPEAVLDASDTKNFIMLRDAMRNMDKSSMLRSVCSDGFMKPVSADMRSIGKITGNGGYTVGEITVTIPIEHISDYNDFVNQLRSDKQFEQLVQDVTIGRIAGKNSLGKNKYRW